MMHNLRLRRDQWLMPQMNCAQAKIGILAIHEIFLRKAAQLMPQGTVDQQKTPHDNIDRAHRIPRPAPVGFGVKHRAARKSCAEPGRFEQQAGHSGPRPTRRYVKRPVSKNGAPTIKDKPPC